jgi:DNA-binding response OmpR family regulator
MQGTGETSALRFALASPSASGFCAPITQRRQGPEEKQKMGFTLDQSTIRELAGAIASEVVKALSEAQLVNSDARAAAAKIDEPEVIHVGPITIDLGRREVTARGRELPLKPRELDCLAALARNAGRALSREQLLDLAWGDAALDRVGSERTVDVHVRRLRLHLGEDAHLLRTMTRIGYRLDPG